MKKDFDLLSMGEIMLRLSPPDNERITRGDTLSKQAGGAELNSATGAAMLGLRCGIISKLPANDLGIYIKNRVRLCGVSDDYLVYDDSKDARLERVVVRAYGREAFYLRDLPFHHSQRELASGEDWTDFEYWLRISNDFYTPLLSRGPNIKALQPQWLAKEIRQQLLKAAGLYE